LRYVTMMKQTILNRYIAPLLLLTALVACGCPARGNAAGNDTTSATGQAMHGGRALLLDKVIFTGNRLISEETLRGALELQPGDTVTIAALARARLDVLYSHPLVRDVRVSTLPGQRLGYVTVEMEITERSRAAFETGFGYHDIYGWFLTVAGLRWQPVKSSDSMWRAGVRIGFHLTGLDADWEKPGMLENGAGAGARFWVYNQEHLFYGPSPKPQEGGQAQLEFRQNISRAGLELYLLYRQERTTRFTFGLRAEKIDPDTTFKDAETGEKYPGSDLPPSMRQAIRRTAITGFQFRMVRDTRDLQAWPRAGSFTSLSLQANTELLGGDEIFTKAEFDTRFYLGTGSWRSINGRMKAGITSSGTPYYDKYFIGGIYSIRGFAELSLTPPRGHDGFWLAGMEWRVPLIPSGSKPPRLTGLLFIDAGQGWLRGEPLTTSTIRSAAGYGFRLRLPWLGMLGIDVGVPLSEGTTDEQFRIHGAIGFSY
jgi:outer membrane protein assembly factor BamA